MSLLRHPDVHIAAANNNVEKKKKSIAKQSSNNMLYTSCQLGGVGVDALIQMIAHCLYYYLRYDPLLG